LLVVGGIFTFVGALWLGVAEWDRLSSGALLGILLALTTGTGVAAYCVAKRGYLRSGGALLTLAAQPLWAHGWLRVHKVGLARAPVTGGRRWAGRSWASARSRSGSPSSGLST